MCGVEGDFAAGRERLKSVGHLQCIHAEHMLAAAISTGYFTPFSGNR